MSTQRKQRVEHGLRDVLTQAISQDIKDPRVRAATLITVSKVEVNIDMSVANVYVSIIGDDATIDRALEGLQKSAKFLRGPVGRELNLQHAPELRFQLDVSIDMSAKIAAILREDEDKARAAGREPAPRIGTPIKPAAPTAAVADDATADAAADDPTAPEAAPSTAAAADATATPSKDPA